MKKILFRALLIIGGAGLGILTAEAGLRIIERAVPETILNDIETHMIYQYNPILGWELTPDSQSKHTTIDYDVTYRINENGFRDDQDWPPKSRKRIVTIGDSYTFGIGVQTEETFSSILEEKSGCEVLNMGVPAYAPSQYLLELETKALGYKPDIAIMAIHIGTDILPGVLKYRSAGTDKYKPYFEIQNNELVLKGVPVPPEDVPDLPVTFRVKDERLISFAKPILGWKTFSLAKDLLKRYPFYPILEKMGLVKTIQDYQSRLETATMILERAQADLAGLNNGKLLVLIITTPTVEYDYLKKKLLNELIKVLESKKIAYVNSLPHIQNSKDLYFKNDSHFNAKGNFLMAEILYEAMAPLIDCGS